MTVPVDVLASYAQVRAYRVTKKAATELAEACAAFAELIEACDYLKRDASNEQWAAFHSALARITGGAV